MSLEQYFIYLIIMAGITYFVRTIPFILIRGKLQNRFIRSFLAYVPYAILSAMTIPAIFYVVHSKIAATIALITAILFSLLGKGLVFVATATCIAVYIANLILG